MKLFLTTVFALIITTSVALAGQCYSDFEAEADQGIRIHSELMVIGLNCQHMGKRYGMNLYGQYRELTARNANLYEEYETALMGFFRKRGDAKPEASLNTLRTKYANKISTDAAGIRPDVFCAKYAPRVQKAHEMSKAELRSWASTFYPSHPVSYPICGG